MGLKDLLPGRGSDNDEPRSALDVAGDPRPDPGTVDRLVGTLVDVGLEGRGPLDPVSEVAERALVKAGGDREKAIAAPASIGLSRPAAASGRAATL